MNDTVKSRHLAPKGGWRWLLIFSLLFNTLVIGLIIGASFKFHGGKESLRAMRPHAAPMVLMRAFRHEERKDFGENMRKRSKNETPHSRLEDVIAALRNSDTEDTMLKFLLETELSRSSHRQQGAHELIVDKIMSMTAPERATYADRIENILTKRERHRHRK